jgi:hypothetical protein
VLERQIISFHWHFKEEFDKLRKPYEFILDVLDYGEHVLVSKKQNKYNVFYPYKGKYLCLSYVDIDNIVLIHIKPITRKLERRAK